MTVTSIDTSTTLSSYQITAIEEILKIVDSEFLNDLENLNILLVGYEYLRDYYNKLVNTDEDINQTLFKFGFIADDVVSIAGGKALYISPHRFKYYTQKAIGKSGGESDSVLTCRLLGIILLNLIITKDKDISTIELVDSILLEIEKFSRVLALKEGFIKFYGLKLSNVRFEITDFLNREFKEIVGEEIV